MVKGITEVTRRLRKNPIGPMRNSVREILMDLLKNERRPNTADYLPISVILQFLQILGRRLILDNDDEEHILDSLLPRLDEDVSFCAERVRNTLPPGLKRRAANKPKARPFARDPNRSRGTKNKVREKRVSPSSSDEDFIPQEVRDDSPGCWSFTDSNEASVGDRGLEDDGEGEVVENELDETQDSGSGDQEDQEDVTRGKGKKRSTKTCISGVSTKRTRSSRPRRTTVSYGTGQHEIENDGVGSNPTTAERGPKMVMRTRTKGRMRNCYTQ